ncbi:MAG: type II toxin-antitoxin system Phd/YefM family antitoxin [Actinobacteria bacterium]|nr:type II toxin-antitoxin system Phd/YefM family antitoxin [Actinomycetota bacterium]
MSLASDIMNNIVPISDFSRGKASSTFAKVSKGAPVIVLRNNVPMAVITSPSEYSYLTEIEEDFFLLSESIERLERSAGKKGTSLEEIMEKHGITEADLDAAEDVEFEWLLGRSSLSTKQRKISTSLLVLQGRKSLKSWSKSSRTRCQSSAEDTVSLWEGRVLSTSRVYSRSSRRAPESALSTNRKLAMESCAS